MREHFSFSAWKGYHRCEAMQLAKDRGEWFEDPSQEMYVGRYIEATLLGVVPDIPPDSLYKKNGALYAAFETANNAVLNARANPDFMTMLQNARTQVHGETIIKGIKVVGIADLLSEKYVSDIKSCVSICEWSWDDELRCRAPFYRAQSYIIQAALYSTIFGRPFRILAIGKTVPFELAEIAYQSEAIAYGLSTFMFDLPRMWAVANGNEPPKRCNRCHYCRSTSGVMHFNVERFQNAESF